MHLKQLTLRGFKSFATATTLTFEPGINCVVGPNGSGKSNVVDALAWVMGEQVAKTLRGGSMADVIFAGTANRPALGRAEVSLTIDNSDGALPISYTEVTISRTLFRSGGSEYAINGSPVRLLDIQELLSDTGMGREMHVIVGQGRLDAVLQATPEERRSFIEEAAGVLKHRRRKEKALRKLESMTGNLNRLSDLTAELRRQLGPLARQAQAARSAQVIQAEVRDAQARLLADDIAQVQARLSAAVEDESRLRAERETLAAQRSAVRDEVAKLEEQRAKANPVIADLTESWQRLSTQAERFTSLVSLAGERARALSVQPESQRRESPEELRSRAASIRADETDLQHAKERAEHALQEAVDRRAKAEDVERELDREISALSRAIADRREDAARLSGRIVTAASRVESLTEEKDRVESARQSALEREADAQAKVAAAEEAIVAHDGGNDELSKDYEELAGMLAAAKQALAEARDEQSEARGRRDISQTRAETLMLSLEPEDGSAGVLDSVPGITGWLRESLDVAEGWEAAAEAALGDTAKALTAEDVDAAIAAIRHVRDGESGRVVIAVRTTAGQGADQTVGASDRTLDDAARAALASVGIDEGDAVLASDAVTGWPGLDRALAGTILAADLTLAGRLVAAGAPRVVTRDGDSIGPDAASGGAVAEASILARQAAARAARAEAETAVKDLAAAGVRVAKSQADLDDIEGRAAAARAEMHARDSQLAASTAELGVLRQSLTAARAEVERNTARLEKIALELASRREELASLEADQKAQDTDPKELEERLAHAQERKTARHAETVAARSGETEGRLALRIAQERVSVISGKADALERHARAEEARLIEEQRRQTRRAHHARIALQVAELAGRTLERVESARDTAARLRREAESGRADRDAALIEARRRLDEVDARIAEVDDAVNRRDVARAEQRIRLDQLEERARADLSMGADELVAEFGPLVDVPTDEGSVPYVREEQQKRLDQAQKKLARLGRINPLALEEHAALEERHTYLSDQLDDLRRSKADLIQIVADIDERVQSVLTDAYRDVQEAFVHVFSTLFPGGEGRLVLTGDDPLTAGLEIEARPPGKRVKRLSLLSGGERSLTALAFLVAIFKARPSPFYVLDEVEAALDDINLGRMLTMFKELQDSSQLIVITHQKRTMEIADTIYGVAMREHGVSTVISQRLKDLRPNEAV
ncbi:chromosome segregation protein SMC [Flaviflexus salsibiostraticola]|uniref:Chromosome partition protein Smc n=1 Tax=Flaviflexus salsibiostraticola TaxID=1282737 RepID=A0A3Q8WT62_9ACTO|nr:chromosome segregation protein SMC [Flaviflexus salsibiostraticola]AZN29735.1 chromosome segregation protein SMC [Flaviflexus salsibiostraticola]